MKFGKIYTYENRDKAEIGKKYVFSQFYKHVCDETILATKSPSKLVKVEDKTFPFEDGGRDAYQFVREVIEEEPVLMTHRQLSEWLAKGNGQSKYKYETGVWMTHIYRLINENEAVDKDIRIRRWDSDEWVVPTVDIYEEDCR